MKYVWARIGRGLAVALAIGIVSTAGACAAATDGAAIAQVNGHPVAYRVLGSGTPVLVMIAGLGDGMNSFEDVASELSKNATVIIYDRAGYGGSTMAPGPRDAEAADRELSGLLTESGVKGPYVLLGHSLGGLFAEYYAARHPDQISGLILEESRPANFTRRCEAAGLQMCVAPAVMMTLAPAGARGEWGAFPATMTQVESFGPVEGKPVLVMSRPVSENATPFDALWSAGQDDLAERYVGARHLTARDSGHYLHNDQHLWFVASVREFLQATSERTW